MRFIIRFKPLFSSPRHKLSVPNLTRFEVFYFSSLSKSSNPKTQQSPSKKQSETTVLASLFNEITDILGADTPIPDKIPSGFPISEQAPEKETVSGGEISCCTQGVRENAEVGFFGEKENMQLVKQIEIDVSPLVHEITRIVRDKNDVVSMEERLQNAGFRFEPDIVERVLKRCFKVPHLALRFFNYVKNRDGFIHTTENYNTMLYIAGEVEEFGIVEELLKEMEGSCEKDIKTWTILIALNGKSNKVGKALLVFEEMRKSGCEPDVAAYKTMIRSLCTAGKGDLALEFYREMLEKDMVADLKLYRVLMECIARTEDIEAVWSVADDMVRICNISDHDVYGFLLKSLCVSGKIREALELIRGLKNKELPLDSKYFEILVKGLCRADRIGDALEIFEIMKRRNLADAKVYGILINGYPRKNDISMALNLFQSMKESGHSPMALTYTELMQHLFKIDEYQKGCELYNEMIENGTELDSVAITAMVAGHVRENLITEAWELFNSMEEKGVKPTWKSYSVFVKELCRVSSTEDILKVLNQMQASKIAIGDQMFQWVLSCMEKKGEVDKIEKVKRMQRNFKSYSEEQKEVSIVASVEEEKLLVKLNLPQQQQGRSCVPPSTDFSEKDVQEICSILRSSADWSRIQKALEKSTIHFTPGLVIEILRKCMMHGNIAMRFFSWLRTRGGYQHTTETYNMAIKIAGCGKDFKHMRSLYHEMRRKGCSITPDTWAIMILRYGRAGLTDIALRTFKEMKDSGCSPNGPTFKCLITVLCGKKGRKVDEAIKMFREMIHLGFVPDRGLAEDFLNCLCEAGKLDQATSCVLSLQKIGFSVPLAYSMYIRSLCRFGKLEEAISLLNEVEAEKSVLEQYTYGSIIHGLLLRGKLEEALAKIESMKQVGINPNVHVYTSLIVHFFKEKQIEKVLETFQNMKLGGCDPSAVTYTAMICGYLNIGKIEEAWDIFHTMKEKGPSPDFKTYSKFIKCLCEMGKSEHAMNLLSEMLDAGIAPSSINFRTVFYGLNREGKQDLARIVMQMKSAMIGRRKLSI